MRFDIITLFPEMFSAIKEEGVIARAIKKSIISITTWQLRDFSLNKYNNVDDKSYGGGAGMVMQVHLVLVGQGKRNNLQSTKSSALVLFITCFL